MPETPFWPKTALLSTLFLGGDIWAEHGTMLTRLGPNTDLSTPLFWDTGLICDLVGWTAVFCAPVPWSWPRKLTCSELGQAYPSPSLSSASCLAASHTPDELGIAPRLRYRSLSWLLYNWTAVVWILLTYSGLSSSYDYFPVKNFSLHIM
jgi:hypothetical protein